MPRNTKPRGGQKKRQNSNWNQNRNKANNRFAKNKGQNPKKRGRK